MRDAAAAGLSWQLVPAVRQAPKKRNLDFPYFDKPDDVTMVTPNPHLFSGLNSIFDFRNSS